MLKKIKEVKHILRNILQSKAYFLIFLSISTLLFLILAYLTLASTTNRSLEIFIMMNGFWYMLTTFFLLAVISILVGIYLCLVIFKIKLAGLGKKGVFSSISGTAGFIVGLFSAGCPMCGAVLFALIGMPLALFFLPFKGIELRVLSILLLAVSIYILARSLVECEIKKEENN